MELYRSVQLKKPERWKNDSPLLRRAGSSICEGRLPGFGGLAIGVDPGVNFGLTLIEGDEVLVCNGALTQQTVKIHYSKIAFDLMCFMLGNRFVGAEAVLENAAFGKPFGAVPLAEVRTGFYLGLIHCGVTVKMLPPMSVRKRVFGDGTIQPYEVWPELNHNGADSLSMALCAI